MSRKKGTNPKDFSLILPCCSLHSHVLGGGMDELHPFWVRMKQKHLLEITTGKLSDSFLPSHPVFSSLQMHLANVPS